MMGVGACHWMSLEESREAEGPITATGKRDRESWPRNVRPGLQVSQLAAELTQESGLPNGVHGGPGPPSSLLC